MPTFAMAAQAINGVTAAIEKQTVAVNENSKAMQLASQFAVNTKERIKATVDEIIKGNKELTNFQKGTMGGWLDTLEEAFERMRKNPMMDPKERAMLENSISRVSTMLAQFGLSSEQLRGKSDQFYREQHRTGGAAPQGAPATTGPTLGSALSTGLMK